MSKNKNIKELKYNRKKEKIMALSLAGILMLSTFTFVLYAKYVSERDTGDLASAAGFYMSSDFLRPESENAKYEVYDNGKEFVVKLFNYENGNTSSVDIEYEITVTNGSASPSSGTMNSSSAVGEQITITPDNKANSVIVTAKATAPYEKTLKATFTINKQDKSNNYSYTDHGVYGELTIHTGSDMESLTINYGSRLAPDNTNPLMTGWTAGTSGTLTNLKQNSTYILMFFENTEGDYTTTDAFVNNGSITIGS